MAFQDLATVADLQGRKIDVTEMSWKEFLPAAQAAVRDAAGVPITRETFTVDIPGRCEEWLPLPGQPVVSVSNVLLDGTAVTDWKLVGGQLWRRCGWLADPYEPCNVTVTVTGGLLEVPADVVDLVCGMVGMAMANATEGGYASRGDVTQSQLSIDDYSEGKSYDSSAQGRTAGPLELPDATRDRLRARFGGGVAVLKARH